MPSSPDKVASGRSIISLNHSLRKHDLLRSLEQDVLSSLDDLLRMVCQVDIINRPEDVVSAPPHTRC